MSISNSDYNKMVKDSLPHSSVAVNCVKAFLFGGGICAFAELLFWLYETAGMNNDEVRAAVPITMIIITAILTSVGVFDKIARHAGAGTIVPITGFANSVVSAALEYKNEGYIMGVGAKIFTVAGPVILYSAASSVLYGIIYFFVHR